MTRPPGVNDDGGLHIRTRFDIPAAEIELRATTSGGPGGQHANRSLTRIIASFDVQSSQRLNDADRSRLLEKLGPVVRSSSGRHRSQAQNRNAALEQLATKIASALERPTPRRATKPTKGSQVRRVDEKKARSQVKQRRRRPDED